MEATSRILLVEDNEDDVLLFRRALKQSGVPAFVHHAEDGQQAMDYLAGIGRFADRVSYPFPRRVFLDLKMPYKGGLEVLAWMRERRLADPFDVFILTSSAESRDLNEAKRLGAQAYFLKPMNHQTLKAILSTDTTSGEFEDNLLVKLQSQNSVC